MFLIRVRWSSVIIYSRQHISASLESICSELYTPVSHALHLVMYDLSAAPQPKIPLYETLSSVLEPI